MVSQDLILPILPRVVQPASVSREQLTVHHLEKRPVVLRDEKERNAYEQEEEASYVQALRERMKEDCESRKRAPYPGGKKKLAQAVEEGLNENAEQKAAAQEEVEAEAPALKPGSLDLYV